jgi:hypothetical protein
MEPPVKGKPLVLDGQVEFASSIRPFDEALFRGSQEGHFLVETCSKKHLRNQSPDNSAL